MFVLRSSWKIYNRTHICISLQDSSGKRLSRGEDQRSSRNDSSLKMLAVSSFQDLSDLRKLIHPKARDLLEKLLRWVPSERISANRALEHEFVQPFRDVDGETALPGRFDDPNSGAVLSPNQWRDVISREIRGMNFSNLLK